MHVPFDGWLNFLNQNKDAFASIQAIGTVLAVFVGGLWAFMTFRRRRLRYPRAKIEHAIRAWQIVEGVWHVHVTITIRNEGEVLLRLREGCAWTQQIDPCPEYLLDIIKTGEDPVAVGSTDVEWPLAGIKRDFKFAEPQEIEPGESDEFHLDIFLRAPIHRILVYTHFSNISKRASWKPWKGKKIGWNNSTFYDFPSSISPECADPTQ
jgi:hypothetical protein